MTYILDIHAACKPPQNNPGIENMSAEGSLSALKYIIIITKTFWMLTTKRGQAPSFDTNTHTLLPYYTCTTFSKQMSKSQ